MAAQDTGQVSVTVTPVNDAPNAVDDSLTTAEDTAGNVNVLANDTDVDGDTLSVTTSTPDRRARDGRLPGHGRLHLHPEPGLRRPRLVQLHDLGRPRRLGHGDRDVTVTPAAPPNTRRSPTTRRSTTPEDVPDSVNVLVGDTDADGDPLTVTSANPIAEHGTVACATGGICQYTPTANYHGPDGFDYTISDGHGGTDTGHVSITVTPVNDDPTRSTTC